MRFISMVAVAAAAAAALALGGVRSPASAVEIPSGSYRETCESIVMQGNSLTARCQDIGGNWRQTTLDMGRCPGGPVANNDGNLVCGPGGYGIGRSLPRGSWRASCRNAYKSGGSLYAECDNGSGGWHNSTLDLDDCPTRLVGNSRGNLYCEETMGGGVLPGGSWRSSCRNASLVGMRLTAECQSSGGSWRTTSIDTGMCPNGSINNENGALTCAGYVHRGYEGGLPPGSWRMSCRNGYITGTMLHAECNDGNGNWRPASFDLRQCAGQLGNNHGSLYCQYGNNTDNDGNGQRYYRR